MMCNIGPRHSVAGFGYGYSNLKRPTCCFRSKRAPWCLTRSEASIPEEQKPEETYWVMVSCVMGYAAAIAVRHFLFLSKCWGATLVHPTFRDNKLEAQFVQRFNQKRVKKLVGMTTLSPSFSVNLSSCFSR